MIKEYNVKDLTAYELKLLTAFTMDNPNKEVHVYYSTNDNLVMGFSLIATTDEPKQISMYGKFDFGNCVDITDYTQRLEEF